MKDRYKTTFKTWNKVASLYQEKFMDIDLYDDSYEFFCGLFDKPNSQILEIGCGPGNITRFLLAKRSDLKIKAIDVAPNMIELARENNPKAEFEVMDCRDIHKINDKFDGIICGFCMPYLSEQDCMKMIADCRLLLKDKGIVYFSTIEGNYKDSGFETGSSGDETYVYYYSKEFLVKTLEKNNFKLENLMTKNYQKISGKSEVHLIAIAKKYNR